MSRYSLSSIRGFPFQLTVTYYFHFTSCCVIQEALALYERIARNLMGPETGKPPSPTTVGTVTGEVIRALTSTVVTPRVLVGRDAFTFALGIRWLPTPIMDALVRAELLQ